MGHPVADRIPHRFGLDPVDDIQVLAPMHRGIAGADEKVKIAPAIKFTLEEALEYIQEDELVEVTPTSIRLRKILLEEHERKRAGNEKATS